MDMRFCFEKFLVWVALLLLICGTVLYAADEGERPKVALVLCGGGAKGAAHVGVLRVLEEEGVKPDLIVGTSIGGIVGGLYSMGYDAIRLDSIVRSLDWQYLMSNSTARRNSSFAEKQKDQLFLIKIPFYTLNLNSDRPFNMESGNKDKKGEEKRIKSPSKESPSALLPMGIINGQNIYNLLTGLSGGYQDSIDFTTDLPIPFACIATDLSTGGEVLLKDGYMPRAMRTTMAIPGYFSPMTIDGKVLVDGGMVNNFPTDVAKAMGADIIIGVDIQNDLYKADQLKSITDVFSQVIGLMGNERYMKNKELADIYIKPDVEGFSTFSFNKEAIDSLISNGYLAADKMRKELSCVAEKVGGARRDRSGYIADADEVVKRTFNISSIEVNGVSQSDAEWLLKRVNLKEGTMISGEEIERAISIFYGTNAFSSVSYKIQSGEYGESRLVLDFVKGAANQFAVGARFDSEEAAAILLYLGIHTNDLFGSRLALTGRLSYNAYGAADYSYVFKNFPSINLSYMFKSTDMNIYERGELSDYMAFYSNKVELSLSNMYLRNFDFKAGLRFESFNYRHFLNDITVDNLKDDSDCYLSYFVNARMDDRDNRMFPERGMTFDAEAALFQPNFNKHNSLFTTLRLNVMGAIPLGKGLTLLPALYFRSLIGNELYSSYANFAGGSEYGRYISQQIPFIGINYANMFDQNIFVGRLDLRGKIANNHYLYGIVNYLRSGESFDYLFNNHGYGAWGAGVKYSYKSPLGPISLNCHWSDYNQKVGLYLNIGYYF